MTWNLRPGTVLSREALQKRFGGRTHGRISPSRQGFVMIFLNHEHPGRRYEGWTGTHVQVLGEGGDNGTDQRMARGNASILNHREEGRTLHLFVPEAQQVRYVGEFAVDEALPWVRTRIEEAPTLRSGSGRLALVFRLLPVGKAPSGLPAARGPVTRTTRLSIPAMPARLGLDEREQAAASLLRAYAEHQARTRTPSPGFTGLHITLPENLAPLEVDLFDEVNRELVIAAPSMADTEMYLSLGELLDLERHFESAPRMVALLPARPEGRRIKWFNEHGITVTWPENGGFVRRDPS
ncbi:hypothetical protein [Kitasatospora sp. NPDC088134]|uniref:hypothetical protein n=1 Tax=Kitasatospora sp. NPDC088134 TaxID=3364071 RepID=UPI00381337E7